VRHDASAFRFDDVSFGGALASLDHSIDPDAETAVFAFGNPRGVRLYVVSLLDQAQLASLQQSGSLKLATLEFTALAAASARFELARVDAVDGAQPPRGSRSAHPGRAGRGSRQLERGP
jgi:hypothetical protein